tara:strand:- start:6837 stop:7253 length:417 start_codon:yes stop_codon:yes gene_type:complete
VENFTPISSLSGGAIIGLAVAIFLYTHGRPAGVSGILIGLSTWQKRDYAWRIIFFIGLILGTLIYRLSFGFDETISMYESPILLIISGLLVGLGTAFSGGCTSGHGVCGISRLSPRSIIATGIFMLAALITVTITLRV